MLKDHRFFRAAWLAPLLMAPAFLADCGSAGPLSLGDANAGVANAGPGHAGSTSAGASGVAGQGGDANATCATSDCGPALGLLNYECDDGSMAGPTGRCLRRDSGTCGWEVLSCPPGSGGSGGGPATGGSGGPATGGPDAGGTSGELCGGKVCGADQACCGPASCGRCIPKFSGQSCPLQCTGGSGGTGSGGTSSGADCTALLANVQSTLADAQGCKSGPSKPEQLECAGTLEGICCPVLVEAATNSNSAANTAYLNALHAYQQSCNHVCPKSACFDPQPGDCVAAQGTTSGTCGGGRGF